MKLFRVIFGKQYCEIEVIAFAHSQEEAIARVKLSHPQYATEEFNAYELIFDGHGCTKTFYIGE